MAGKQFVAAGYHEPLEGKNEINGGVKLRVIYALLLGFLSVSLLSITTIEKIDLPLKIAIFSMSIAMPSIAFYIIVDDNKKYYSESKNIKKLKNSSMAMGGVFGLASIACIFFHFTIISGIIFSILSVMFFWQIALNLPEQ